MKAIYLSIGMMCALLSNNSYSQKLEQTVKTELPCSSGFQVPRRIDHGSQGAIAIVVSKRCRDVVAEDGVPLQRGPRHNRYSR